MLLLCKYCNYEWSYGGSSTMYATCPRCHYKINVNKSKVDLGSEMADDISEGVQQ